MNSKGVIKGVKSGTATITAKVVQNKKTYYVNLAVKVCDPQKDWYKRYLIQNPERIMSNTMMVIKELKWIKRK